MRLCVTGVQGVPFERMYTPKERKSWASLLHATTANKPLYRARSLERLVNTGFRPKAWTNVLDKSRWH